MTIDLPKQTITGPDGSVYAFAIDALRKRRLIKGVDEISLTNEFQNDILNFETKYRSQHPWLN